VISNGATCTSAVWVNAVLSPGLSVLMPLATRWRRCRVGGFRVGRYLTPWSPRILGICTSSVSSTLSGPCLPDLRLEDPGCCSSEPVESPICWPVTRPSPGDASPSYAFPRCLTARLLANWTRDGEAGWSRSRRPRFSVCLLGSGNLVSSTSVPLRC